jgi:hypothetical protein
MAIFGIATGKPIDKRFSEENQTQQASISTEFV